jgi:hypothetical protein
MDLFSLFTALGMVGLGIYLIRIGILILTNPKFRDRMAHLWFKTESSSEKRQAELHTKGFQAPMYILAGCALVYFGVSLLLEL